MIKKTLLALLLALVFTSPHLGFADTQQEELNLIQSTIITLQETLADLWEKVALLSIQKQKAAAFIPSDGLVGHWNLDEGSGTTVSDSSGNGNVGTLKNGPSWTTGNGGGALNFDGVNDYVEVPDAPELNLTGQEVTLAAWIYMDTAQTEDVGIIVKSQSRAAEYNLQLGIQSTNKANFRVQPEGKSRVYHTAGDPLTVGQWHHLVGVYDVNRSRIYVDGVEVGSVSAATANLLPATGEPLLIGRRAINDDRYFEGVIDDARIYNRALSAADVASLYQLGQGNNPPPPPPPSSPAPTASISVSPTSITDGGSATLTWNSSNATACTGTNFSTSNATAGSINVSPSSNTTYAVNCSGEGGNANDSTTVTVSTPATPSAGWTETAGFESGVIGQIAIGVDALDNGGYNNTTFTNEVVRSGNQAAKMTANQGYTDWGAYNSFPEPVGEGEELWMRYYLYFPDGFDFSCTQCAGIKTMRIHVRSASGVGEGHIDVLIGQGGLNTASEVANQDFFDNWPNGSWSGLGETVPTGEWHAIEQYVKFSSTPGQGIYRVWQNGELIFEDTETYTLQTSTSVANYSYIFGYWNGTAPKTQSAYFDDFVITTQTPGKVDAHGNPYIGVDSSTQQSDTQSPSQPTGLHASALSKSQISLTWNASSDNKGVTGYNIYRNGSAIASSVTTAYTDSGLSEGTTYTYTIVARDAAGNTSGHSSGASATTHTTPAQSGGWTFTADFETGTIGEKANGPSGFTGGRKLTVYSNAQAHGGSQSAKAGISQGSSGFNEWGGKIDFPTDLTQGDEIWYRVWIYYPHEWIFGSGPKGLRIHLSPAGGGNIGYFDYFILGDGLKPMSEIGTALRPIPDPCIYGNNSNWGQFRCNMEKLGNPNDYNTVVTKGEWHAFEMYLKLHSEPGKAMYRAWYDGELIFEDPLTATMHSSNDVADFAYLFTTWNNGAPATQHNFVDDIVITNQTPSTKDAHGNPYIGLGSSATPQTPALSATLSASPMTITSGNSATLSWTSVGAVSCAGSGFSTGGATSGSVSVTPTANTTYTVNCGTASDSITVTVAPSSCSSFIYTDWGSCRVDGTQSRAVVSSLPAGCTGGSPTTAKSCVYVPATPSISLQANPQSLAEGESTILSWIATDVGSCTSSGFDSRGLFSGVLTLYPTSNTLYGLTCDGVTESASVSVSPLPETCTSFNYSAWGPCQSDYTQSRSVLSSVPSGCINGEPITKQSCTYAGTAPEATICSSFTYSSWGACQTNSTQTRSVVSSSPNNCTGGAPVTSKSCSYTPPSTAPISGGGGGGGGVFPRTCTAFTYNAWGTCLEGGTQSRSVASAIPSGCTGGTPVMKQSCETIVRSESSYVFSKNITYGEESEEVKELQKRLNDLGFTVAQEGDGAPGNETTTFSAGTLNALNAFQKSKGLVQTAVVDKTTRHALNGTTPESTGDVSLRELLVARIAELTKLVESLTKQLTARLGGSSSTVRESFSKPLIYRDDNEEVRKLQRALNGIGYTISISGPGSPGSESTYYGQKTRSAIQKFQCEKGIVCSGAHDSTGYGRFGPATRQALNSALNL